MKFPEKKIIEIALNAGKIAMLFYKSENRVFFKKNNTIFSIVDLLLDNFIQSELRLNYNQIPVVTEESKYPSFNKRRKWSHLWLVDPLDGSSEYMSGKRYFTINIALVSTSDGPIGGVIYAPALNKIYWTKGKISFNASTDKRHRIIKSSIRKLSGGNNNRCKVILSSQSHFTKATKNYINVIRNEYKKVKILKIGSSIKMCMLADGQADIYPRFGSTMEWDIAAGHAIAKYSSVVIKKIYGKGEITYNKRTLKNPFFIMERK